MQKHFSNLESALCIAYTRYAGGASRKVMNTMIRDIREDLNVWLKLSQLRVKYQVIFYKCFNKVEIDINE